MDFNPADILQRLREAEAAGEADEAAAAAAGSEFTSGVSLQSECGQGGNGGAGGDGSSVSARDEEAKDIGDLALGTSSDGNGGSRNGAAAGAGSSRAAYVPLSTRDMGVQTHEDLAQELDVARMQLQHQDERIRSLVTHREDLLELLSLRSEFAPGEGSQVVGDVHAYVEKLERAVCRLNYEVDLLHQQQSSNVDAPLRRQRQRAARALTSARAPMPSAASALESAMGGMASGDQGPAAEAGRRRPSGSASVGSGGSVTLPDWGAGAAGAPRFAQPKQTEKDRTARSRTQGSTGPGRARMQSKRREQTWRPPFSPAVSKCSFRKSEAGSGARAGRVHVPEEVQRVAREHQPVLAVDLAEDD